MANNNNKIIIIMFFLSKHLDIGKIINKKKFFRLCRHLFIYIQCILLPKDIDIGKIRKKQRFSDSATFYFDQPEQCYSLWYSRKQFLFPAT